MPGNREVYEASMREAANAAWDHQWEAATAAYQIAVGEFPEDSNALTGLGLALMEAGRLEEALEVYNRAVQLSPDDPIVLEKSADVLERMGRLEEAGNKYVAVAEIHLSRRNVERAIANWERAAGLLPNEVKLRSRLAVAYERTDQNKKAVREYVALGAVFQRMNDVPKATQALQRALKIDPNNDKVRDILAALRAGSQVELPDAQDPAIAKKEGFEAFTTTSSTEVQLLSPMAEAAERAMGMLAELLFDADLSAKIQAQVAEAIEKQRSGDASSAATTYAQAIKSGLDHHAAWFNSGLLYFQLDDEKQSVNALERVVDVPEFAVAANLVLGRVHMKAEAWDNAARYLVQALRYADLTMAPGQEAETDAAYDAMLQELDGQDEEKLRSLSQALLEILNTDDWRKRLLEVRARLESGYASGLVQSMLEEGAENVTGVLERINRYISDGLLLLAMEEAHYAVELSPGYLPVHARMADILAKENKPTEAAGKYTMIANAYLARGEGERAADMFAEALQLSPMDVASRQHLIDMFVGQGRIAEALDHYEDMAGVYLTMADADNARKTYQGAINLAQQSDASPEQTTRLLYKIADLDVQNLDWRQALGSYEQIKELVPGEEKAIIAIVDLHFRLGQIDHATQELDAYLTYCIQNNKIDRVVPVLEEQVRNRPDEIALRQRLAKAYQEQKRLPEAIAQLDALGELLLEAGRHEDAVEVISQIVSLNPPDVDGYRQLLQRLQDGSSPS
jgi:tetratricopeptide (TPR) repeat protein